MHGQAKDDRTPEPPSARNQGSEKRSHSTGGGGKRGLRAFLGPLEGVDLRCDTVGAVRAAVGRGYNLGQVTHGFEKPTFITHPDFHLVSHNAQSRLSGVLNVNTDPPCTPPLTASVSFPLRGSIQIALKRPDAADRSRRKNSLPRV